MKNNGWRLESKRHSLARQGIKTGRKITDMHNKVNFSSSLTEVDEYSLKRSGGNNERLEL